VLRVGLTGGIGAGKSTVAARLAEHGAVVVDADQISREVVAPGTEGLADVVAAFGTQVLAPDGSLDRAAVAARVFADPEALKQLNAIVHPRVGARSAELIAAAPDDTVLVHDVPLLVENRLAPVFHLVIVVDAPVDERVQRLVARGLPEADARARIANQATDEQRRAVADVSLDNAGAPESVLAAVDALWSRRLVSYEENVRLGRYARRGAPRIAPPDPTWPEQAARLAARIRNAAGEAAVTLDHVGSTAVPGLAAKDVIDLQLGVASLDATDDLADALRLAGFPAQLDITADNPKPVDPDPSHWRKRFHRNADPGRDVNLHVREFGSAGWRYALLFRDWLRADETERAKYEAHKRELADAHAADPTTAKYAGAKEPWFDEALPRAEAWAEATAWSPG